jgi:transcriptional regulator with XRE-family HTH domain
LRDQRIRRKAQYDRDGAGMKREILPHGTKDIEQYDGALLERLATGETNPTLGSLATIARALKVTTSKLLEGVD